MIPVARPVRRARWAGRATALAGLVLVVAACTSGVGGGVGSGSTDAGRLPGPYSQVVATFRAPDGGVSEACVLLADTPQERSQGLMGVQDLDPWPAMVFDFGEPVSGGFWMKDTVLALSIAFFDEFGVYVSEADMEPCLTEDCPSTLADRPYRYAVETEQGELGTLDIGFGGSITLGGPCEAGEGTAPGG